MFYTLIELSNYTSENIMLRFFYNCTSYPDPDHSIKRLQYADTLSFMYEVGKILELDLPAECTSIVNVSVIAGPTTEAAVGISALQYGFKLTWQFDDVCQYCEISKGICTIDCGVFVCRCNGIMHPRTCHDKRYLLLLNLHFIFGV